MDHIEIIDLENPLWANTLEKLNHDIYHLPEYFRVEVKRTPATPKAFVLIDGTKIFFVPFLLRRCNDLFPNKLQEPIFDVSSPYGYSSILMSQSALDTPDFPRLALQELRKLFLKHNICSAFLRSHPILNQKFSEAFEPGTFTEQGETVSVDLTLSESGIWAKTRKGHQSSINKCKRLGFTSRFVPFREHIDEFIHIYEENMRRVQAKDFYYFERTYFEDLVELGDKVQLGLAELDDKVISACLFFEHNGIVQAHLGGTLNEFSSQSPFMLILADARLWFKQRGNTFLHLGGGIGSSKDRLFSFKKGFSRQRFHFSTLRLVINERLYNHLVKIRAEALNSCAEDLLQSNFFPAYRPPVSNS